MQEVGASGALLEDYLAEPDFGKALRGLAGPLGDELGLPDVEEIGVVCPNVVLAAEALKRRWPKMTTLMLGAGSPSTFWEDGQKRNFTTRVGFGAYKGVLVELAEPGIGSNIFGQTPNPAGQVVINHIGYMPRGPTHLREDGGVERAWSDLLAAHRVPKQFEAILGLLGFRAHVYIYETVLRTQGVDLEFLDFRLFTEHGLKLTFPARLAGLVGWLQANVGPRVFQLPSEQELPPAPVPRAELPGGPS
jgi:hypothetical protein